MALKESSRNASDTMSLSYCLWVVTTFPKTTSHKPNPIKSPFQHLILRHPMVP